jgi:hypothetical protein
MPIKKTNKTVNKTGKIKQYEKDARMKGEQKS